MRLKLILSAMMLCFVGSIAFIPQIILSHVERVEVISVKTQMYQEVVHCNGEIIQREVHEVYLETPVIASDVRVRIGDKVLCGETMAVINKKLTELVLAQQGSIPVTNNEIDEFAVLAQRYGVSANEVRAAIGQGNTQEVANSNGTVPAFVTAPISGIVTAINLKKDVLTQNTRPVITVSDNKMYAALVEVSEADIAKLQEGDTAILTGAGFEGKNYTGYIARIYPTARKTMNGAVQQTVVDVEITLDAPDESIRPGYSAKAVLFTQSAGDMLAVPYEAVRQDENNREYVYVYCANRVERRYISTGRELTDALEVLDGLTVNERIVASVGDGLDESRFFLPQQRNAI